MNTIEERFKRQRIAFFISCSPFQVMCMIEAIDAFNPKNYMVFLCFEENELPRKKQTLTLLNLYNINYKIESFNYHITKLDRIKMLKPVYDGFDIVFIGDCCDELLIYKATRYVSNGGTLIYLDDGTATIQFFNGLFQIKGKLRKYYNLVCRLRHINFDCYFFTIFKDLSDGRHKCIYNDFHFFSSMQLCKIEKKYIILLGVSTDDYCNIEQISPLMYFNELKKIFLELKKRYPNESILYIPHGKDTHIEPQRICEELCILYSPTSISVEMFLLEQSFRPFAVYGFTSSALYNIKLLFPDTDVYNIVFYGNTPLTNRIEHASEYYEKHGISKIVKYLEK